MYSIAPHARSMARSSWRSSQRGRLTRKHRPRVQHRPDAAHGEDYSSPARGLRREGGVARAQGLATVGEGVELGGRPQALDGLVQRRGLLQRQELRDRQHAPQQHHARARGQLDQHVRREAHIGQGHARLHDQGFICV